MESTHFIRDFNVDISFPSETEAFGEHSVLDSFVSQRLVAVADEVFNAAMQSSALVLNIDALEIDLGELPARGFYAEAESRFRKRLAERIRHEVYEERLRDPSAVQPSEDRAVEQTQPWRDATQRDLDLVVWWLERGYLPWNSPSFKAETLEEMLRRVITERGSQFVSRMREAGRAQTIARRLAWHTSPELRQRIAELLRSQSSEKFWSIIEEGNWETEFEHLLEEQDEAAVVRRSIWQAIVEGDPHPPGGSWDNLLRDMPELVKLGVQREGMRAEVRHAMAANLDDRTLAEMLRLLEPQESNFIQQVVSRPDLFIGEAQRQSGTSSQIKVTLWESSLTYVLVERGTDFNRRAFLESVARQMAAHCRIDYGFAMQSLNDFLHTTPSIERTLNDTLNQPDETLFRDAALTSSDPFGADSLLSRLGSHASIRTLLAHRLPADALLEIVRAVDSSAVDYLRDLTGGVIAARDILSPAFRDVASLDTMLWGVTLACLFDRSSSVFDKRGHGRSMVEQVAIRYELNYAALLNAVEAALLHAGIAGSSQNQMLDFVKELKGEDSGAQSGRFDRQWIGLCQSAIRRGQWAILENLWSTRSNAEPESVQDVFAPFLADKHERQILLEALPLDVMREAAETMLAGGTTLMRQMAERADIFRQAVSLTNDSSMERAIWEFSFEYAAMRAGKSLNAHSFLEAILPRIAARHKLRTDEFVRRVGVVQTQSATASRMSKEFEDYASTWTSNERDTNQQYDDEQIGRVRLLHAYQLHDHALECLSRTDDATASELNALLSQMQKECPWALRRILRQADPLQAADVFPRREFESRCTYVQGKGWIVSSPSVAKNRARYRPTAAPDSSDNSPYFLLTDKRRHEPMSNAIESVMKSLLADSDPLVLTLLSDVSKSANAIGDLSRALSQEQLASLFLLGGNSRTWEILEIAEWMADAADLQDRGLLWRFLFGYSKQSTAAEPDAAFVGAFLRVLANTLQIDRGALKAQLIASLRLEGRAAGSALCEKIAKILEEMHAEPARAIESSCVSPAKIRPSAMPVRLSSGEDSIFILNAGQVLASPFLPRLFTVAGLMNGSQFKDPSAVHRGVHLLQYLVDGSSNAPEYLLPLNKILCGLEPENPVRGDIELSQVEVDAAEDMIRAMIAHWSAIGQTSSQGLRESFLQRRGRLSAIPRGWHLLVEQRPFDMLLDRMPWNFKVTKHQWMRTALYTEWR
jgi:hypothetical protein